MSKILTKSALQWLPPHTILGGGTFTKQDGSLWRWVAKRGSYHDWAMYHGDSEWSDTRILESGNKIMDKELINQLLPSDDEAMALYRY